MSTLRTNTLETTDSLFSVEIEDLSSLFLTNGAQFIGNGLVVVNNVAALLAYDFTKPAKTIMTLGYYTPGDGGHGHYRYDAADLVTASNGGTVHVGLAGARIKLIHQGVTSIKQWGAKGDGVADDYTFIQKAIDSGVNLVWPVGNFALSLSQNITLEAGPTVAALIAKDGMGAWYGAGMGRTVISILNNQSTDASPKFFNLMAANTVINFLYLKDITFDINGQNNKISPNRGSDVYNPYNCAALMVSGSVATGGADARLHNAKILNCEVKNSPGVSCFALGQRFGHPGVKGDNVEIAGCRFFNNGIDSADHSSIYAFSDNVDVHDNVFDFGTPSTGALSPVCCVETFGSFIKVHDNTVRNYMQFAWVGQGEEGQHNHVHIVNNTGSITYRGVDFWSVTPQDDGISDVVISDNEFTILSATLRVDTLDRVGINMAPVNGDVFRVKIADNKFYCLDRKRNAGIVLSATATHSLQDLDIHNNSFSGFSRGIAAGGAGTLLSVTIDDNNIEDCAVTTAIPAATRGIDISGNNTFCTMNIKDNKIGSGDLGVPPQNGINIAGTMANLDMDGNAIIAGTTLINDVATVSGRRRGLQATTFGGLPAQSTWSIGDVATSRTKPFAGAPGSVYVLDGWTRITNGTGNVLNSDWLERRIPSGT